MTVKIIQDPSMWVKVVQNQPTWQLRLIHNQLTSESRSPRISQCSGWSYSGSKESITPGPTIHCHPVPNAPDHYVPLFPPSQTCSTPIFWMISCVPGRWYPRRMVWLLGKFIGVAWTLGSWDNGTATLSTYPPHPSSLLSFPRDSWIRHCSGHDLSEWLKGCNMHAKPDAKKINNSWLSFPEVEIFLFLSFLSSVDLIKDGIYKQCKSPLMPNSLHFSNDWRYPHLITARIHSKLWSGTPYRLGWR